MRTKVTCWATILAMAASAGWAAKKTAAKTMVDFINPMIGAGTGDGIYGKTFPGAATPFGLVQLSPDTVTGGDNGPGYSLFHANNRRLQLHPHERRGLVWRPGQLPCHADHRAAAYRARRRRGPSDGYRSRFRHETEIAQAGYYAVTLDDYKVRAEAAAAPAQRHAPLHVSQVRPDRDPDRSCPAGRRHLHAAVRARSSTTTRSRAG